MRSERRRAHLCEFADAIVFSAERYATRRVDSFLFSQFLRVRHHTQAGDCVSLI